MITKSAGGVIINNKREVVLCKQIEEFWSLPKGHVLDGEDDLTAAKREILEETGIDDLTLVKHLGSYEREALNVANETKIMHFYLFSTDQTKLHSTADDVSEVRWVSFDKAPQMLTHSKDAQFLLSVLESL